GAGYGPPWAGMPGYAGSPKEYTFDTTGMSAADLYATWDRSVARSRQRLADAVDAGGLDQQVALGADQGVVVSLRRLVVDLLEEYARHTSHADLLREAVDGRVGGDPPPDRRGCRGRPPPAGGRGPGGVRRAHRPRRPAAGGGRRSRRRGPAARLATPRSPALIGPHRAAPHPSGTAAGVRRAGGVRTLGFRVWGSTATARPRGRSARSPRSRTPRASRPPSSGAGWASPTGPRAGTWRSCARPTSRSSPRRVATAATGSGAGSDRHRSRSRCRRPSA